MDDQKFVNFAKGYAFEWDVGLFLQHTEGTRLIVPQARLNRPPDDTGFTHVFLDFYEYVLGIHNGTVYSVKWWNGPQPNHLEADRVLLEATVSFDGNSERDSKKYIDRAAADRGEYVLRDDRLHINIKTRRPFRDVGEISYIVQDRIKGYRQQDLDYLALADLEDPDSPFIRIQERIKYFASEQDLEALEELELTLYRLFMQGFETDSPMDFLDDYVTNFLEKGHIVPTTASYNYDPRNPHHHRRFGVISSSSTQKNKDLVKHIRRTDGTIETTLYFIERRIYEPQPEVAEPEENLDMTHPDNSHLVGNGFVF